MRHPDGKQIAHNEAFARMIAKRLGRHRSTTDRELRRNSTSAGYHSEFAQMSYHQHRKNSRPKGKRTDEITAVIEEKLSATWSPEQIVERGSASPGVWTLGDILFAKHTSKPRKFTCTNFGHVGYCVETFSDEDA